MWIECLKMKQWIFDISWLLMLVHTRLQICCNLRQPVSANNWKLLNYLLHKLALFNSCCQLLLEGYLDDTHIPQNKSFTKYFNQLLKNVSIKKPKANHFCLPESILYNLLAYYSISHNLGKWYGCDGWIPIWIQSN